MSYERINTTTTDEKTINRWRLQAGERSWMLTQTKWRDGNPVGCWGIAECDGSKGETTLGIKTDADDTDPRPTINWPCYGAQEAPEARAFRKDLAATIQAATEIEYIIALETAAQK